MYFPYLRGKQYELLAIRELNALPLDSKKVAPIIEPLNISTKALKAMVKKLDPSLKILLIINPEHGDIPNGSDIIPNFIDDQIKDGYVNLVPTFLIATNADYTLAEQMIRRFGYDKSGYGLIHQNPISNQAAMLTFIASTNAQYNIISATHSMSLKSLFSPTTLGYLEDKFIKRGKNADYLPIGSEFFSSTHQYYRGYGYSFFGDYLTIGSGYVAGGWSPWAVVIHLTYINKTDGSINIRHFVSDSNADDKDTAGKFAEALAKLLPFINSEGIYTLAANEFRAISSRGTFHGLGTIKKLSIMNHIELLQSLV